MAVVLGDESLYEYTGGRPPTPEELRARYARQVLGHAPDGRQGWLNWIVRHRPSGAVIGLVQATFRDEPDRASAEVAWITAVSQQGNGYAREAAAAMLSWLRQRGVGVFIAHIHPEHQASIAIAKHLGLTATHVRIGGEVRWISEAD